jgi:ElaA protein
MVDSDICLDYGNGMKTVVKKFDELSAKEIYEILKTRSEVFVVEQSCIYQDIDDKDYDSLHVFIEDGNRVVAYLRIYRKDEDTMQLGRVLSLKHGIGLGKMIMEEGIRQVREKFDCKKIYIEAQCQAIGYYEKAGFKVCSGEFLEDGIPHVQMILDLESSK